MWFSSLWLRLKDRSVQGCGRSSMGQLAVCRDFAKDRSLLQWSAGSEHGIGLFDGKDATIREPYFLTTGLAVVMGDRWKREYWQICWMSPSTPRFVLIPMHYWQMAVCGHGDGMITASAEMVKNQRELSPPSWMSFRACPTSGKPQLFVQGEDTAERCFCLL
mmetsp:Transcript_20198/g.51583  ORF Transcript_20198/g.51583 Transcript_20198/m.51583 type:complete len:162 (-) Transcript_20198:263-748(-)